MLWETLASLAGTILAVLLIIGLAYWFTKHVAGSGALGGFRAGAGNGQMKVLGQLSLGKDQRLAVVAVGAQFYLLGITPGGISLVAELTEEEADLWRQEQAPPPPSSFREALKSYTRQKKGSG